MINPLRRGVFPHSMQGSLSFGGPSPSNDSFPCVVHQETISQELEVGCSLISVLVSLLAQGMSPLSSSCSGSFFISSPPVSLSLSLCPPPLSLSPSICYVCTDKRDQCLFKEFLAGAIRSECGMNLLVSFHCLD